MLMYHLFYAVQNSKSSYTETKCFQLKSDALKEAIQLCHASNVKFVSIRKVNVTSLGLDILKKPDNLEVEEV